MILKYDEIVWMFLSTSLKINSEWICTGGPSGSRTPNPGSAISVELDRIQLSHQVPAK